jgi:hypothetical protein
MRFGALGIVIAAGYLLAIAASRAERTAPASRSAVVFVDVAPSAGIRFVHDNAASPEKYLIETMGAGAGWLDYNNDGHLDLYLVNSSGTKAYKPAARLQNALYRNNGDGSFTDVTGETGTDGAGIFGMGLAAGDFDNDGWTDIYVTGYNGSVLYRNRGDGKFADVTAKAGVANRERWGSSPAWFDYDKDGLLDLVVVNYVDWSPENNIFCGEPRPGYRSYCHPNKFRGQRPALYRNNGDGTFSNTSNATGIGSKPGNGLGVVCFDFDGDGWQDVFIANDSMENFLYRNRAGKKFEEVAIESGVAYGEDGKAEAGMGVDAADYDNDGRLDLVITHLDREFNRLYRNLGGGTFEDATFSGKLGYHNYTLSGFGTRFMDYDNDGWRDLFIANGHVLDNISLFHADTAHAERKTMYRNNRGVFAAISDQVGKDMLRPKVSRAAAMADYDNDGDLDMLVSNNGGAPELLRNEGGNARHWLQVKLTGVKSNRDGIGAKIRVVAGGTAQVDEAKGGTSYQSAHDPRIHFGLGAATHVELVEVRWPSGVVDRVTGVKANSVVTIREGGGAVPR